MSISLGAAPQPASGPTARELLGDPAWLPHQLLDGGRTLRLVHAPRAAHQAATFLDDDGLKESGSRLLPVDALCGVAGGATLAFVFHSAFCCSTLLARALDLPGVSMGFKEPAILNDLAALHRSGRSVSGVLPAILALLGRPLAPGEHNVLKPSNVANILIEPLLNAVPGAHAVLLYAPLREFLMSIAGKGLWGRVWMRRLSLMLRASPQFDPGFSEADLFIQTDLQVAALAWLQHQKQFARVVSRFGHRVRTLSSPTLLARREPTMVAVADHLRLPIAPDAVPHRLRPDVFTEHSKRLGERYDADQRAEDQRAAESAYAGEIDMVVSWAAAIARQFQVPLELDRALSA